jgi:hypothetical protein
MLNCLSVQHQDSLCQGFLSYPLHLAKTRFLGKRCNTTSDELVARADAPMTHAVLRMNYLATTTATAVPSHSCHQCGVYRAAWLFGQLARHIRRCQHDRGYRTKRVTPPPFAIIPHRYTGNSDHLISTSSARAAHPLLHPAIDPANPFWGVVHNAQQALRDTEADTVLLGTAVLAYALALHVERHAGPACARMSSLEPRGRRRRSTGQASQCSRRLLLSQLGTTDGGLVNLKALGKVKHAELPSPLFESKKPELPLPRCSHRLDAMSLFGEASTAMAGACGQRAASACQVSHSQTMLIMKHGAAYDALANITPSTSSGSGSTALRSPYDTRDTAQQSPFHVGSANTECTLSCDHSYNVTAASASHRSLPPARHEAYDTQPAQPATPARSLSRASYAPPTRTATYSSSMFNPKTAAPARPPSHIGYDAAPADHTPASTSRMYLTAYNSPMAAALQDGGRYKHHHTSLRSHAQGPSISMTNITSVSAVSAAPAPILRRPQPNQLKSA